MSAINEAIKQLKKEANAITNHQPGMEIHIYPTQWKEKMMSMYTLPKKNKDSDHTYFVWIISTHSNYQHNSKRLKDRNMSHNRTEMPEKKRLLVHASQKLLTIKSSGPTAYMSGS